ncbi:MAG: thioredoxin fold domain-containing protein [Gammaproteobacteria bacterium]|nr:thioredoxin fold domain-containing protein [Gammaproteobacteria bacterium]
MKQALFLLLIIGSFLSGVVLAKSPEDVRSWLLKVRPDMQIETIADSPIKGMYEVGLAGGHVLHITQDGIFFIAGDLYQVTESELINLTEFERNDRRKELLAAIDESEMLIFSPENPQKTVTVFTDFDCSYCRKLHQEVPELNKLGIAIRYLAYPRAGVPSASYDKMVSAWCAEDPNSALTQAKLGRAIPQKTCANPVARHYRLGEDFGVTGTPALIFEDGQLVPGYMPATALAARLGIN